jgi:hypothetical protein
VKVNSLRSIIDTYTSGMDVGTVTIEFPENTESEVIGRPRAMRLQSGKPKLSILI